MAIANALQLLKTVQLRSSRSELIFTLLIRYIMLTFESSHLVSRETVMKRCKKILLSSTLLTFMYRQIQFGNGFSARQSVTTVERLMLISWRRVDQTIPNLEDTYIHTSALFLSGTIAMTNSQIWGSELSQVWRGDSAVIAASNASFRL